MAAIVSGWEYDSAVFVHIWPRGGLFFTYRRNMVVPTAIEELEKAAEKAERALQLAEQDMVGEIPLTGDELRQQIGEARSLITLALIRVAREREHEAKRPFREVMEDALLRARKPDFEPRTKEMLSLAYAFGCENKWLERANKDEIPAMVICGDAPEIRRLRQILKECIVAKIGRDDSDVLGWSRVILSTARDIAIRDKRGMDFLRRLEEKCRDHYADCDPEIRDTLDELARLPEVIADPSMPEGEARMGNVRVKGIQP